MSVRIIFPDYPTKVKMSETRRKKFFHPTDGIPKKYQNENYIFKDNKLFNVLKKEFVIKNKKFIDQPRYQALSYNKISTPLKVPVLIKLKEWMSPFMPTSLGLSGPLKVSAIVYDWPIPLNKDLDNMHIYYKAFLDLMKERGMIIDDSKRYITRAGGFRFIPIVDGSDRKLVFEIEEEESELIRRHLMFNLEPKEVVRGEKNGFGLRDSKDTPPGELIITGSSIMLMNFGKTKIIKSNANKLFKSVFKECVNRNRGCWVNPEFYRVHVDRIQKFLLQEGIPVTININ